jgi:hypothetical protein
VTGEELFAEVVRLSQEAGWEFGGPIALYITPGSDKPMRRTDRTGQPCHWILEVHLVDRQRQIGAFCEELLDL